MREALAAALERSGRRAPGGAGRGGGRRARGRWRRWARLGDAGRDVIERYAAYRVGYHRGLDTLRANGWRGSGYVRWEHPGNRGFLRALAGLQRTAAEIGEDDEAERCAQFLRQLDPAWPPPELDGVTVAVRAAPSCAAAPAAAWGATRRPSRSTGRPMAARVADALPPRPGRERGRHRR